MSLLKNLALRVRQTRNDNPEEESICRTTPYSDSYLLDAVMSMDSVPEKSRVGSSYIHVSSLISMCVRAYVLAYVSQVERESSVQASMRLVWALGRAAEAHVREQFLKSCDYNGVVGNWSCKCGHLKNSGLYNGDLNCTKCGKKANKYGEAALFDHTNRIVGSPDLLYIRPDNKKVMVVECKSINKKNFDTLTEPKVDHILQAAAYNRLLSMNGGDADDFITIFYVCKDYQFASPYKEFRVPMNRTGLSMALDGMWDKAKVFTEQKNRHDNKDSVAYPERLRACTGTDSTTAKACSFAGMCFSIQ